MAEAKGLAHWVVPASLPNHLTKTPSPNTIALGIIRFQHRNWDGGGTNIHSKAILSQLQAIGNPFQPDLTKAN